MTVYYENEKDFTLPFDCEALAKKVLAAVAAAEGCPYEVQVSLILTDDEAIREVNLEYRDMDKATDVLSFPAHQYETPSDFSGFLDDDFDMDTGELILGDIMISYERAVSQAAEYGHTIEREVAFLIAHSAFHLLGYDHMEDEERKIMEEKQESVLSTLHINR